eukprot:1160538-Pelagomonas_calceolata.AAC.7
MMAWKIDKALMDWQPLVWMCCVCGECMCDWMCCVCVMHVRLDVLRVRDVRAFGCAVCVGCTCVWMCCVCDVRGLGCAVCVGCTCMISTWHAGSKHQLNNEQHAYEDEDWRGGPIAHLRVSSSDRSQGGR